MPAHAAPSPLTARASGPLAGTALVPGDKSVSHRALILGALAVGTTRIEGLLEGQDVLDTAAAMRAFGAEVTKTGPGAWEVAGVGVGGFAEPGDVIDCGNSGTGVRLVMGAMATTPVSATFTGDASLRRRPMGRVTGPLERFGARAFGRQGGRLPMTIVGAADPVPVRYAPAGRLGAGEVRGPARRAECAGRDDGDRAEATRDHTERMLRDFGATLAVEQTPEAPGDHPGRPAGTQAADGCRAAATRPRPPSWSAAALIVPGSEVTVPGVPQPDARPALSSRCSEMGADIAFENHRDEGGEPVADIVVRHSAG